MFCFSVIKQSLFFYFKILLFYSLVVVLPFISLQHSLVPYLSFMLWALIVYFVPVNLIPWPIIWLYDKLLWVTGPVLMITEIILAVNFQMRCSQMAIDRIEEDDSPGFKVIKQWNLQKNYALHIKLFIERSFYLFLLSLSFTLKVHALI